MNKDAGKPGVSEMKKTGPSSGEKAGQLPEKDSGSETFVFLDKKGKRWPRLRLVLFVFGTLAFLGLVLFVQSLISPSQLTLPPAVLDLKSRLKGLEFKDYQSRQRATSPLWQDFNKRNHGPKKTLVPQKPQNDNASASGGKGLKADASREIRLGFYESWDPDALDSLKAHIGQLTHLCPDGLFFGEDLGTLRVSKNDEVAELAKSHGVVTLPLLRNLGPDDAWKPEEVEGLINGPPARQKAFADTLVETLEGMQAGGVIVDWQQVDPSYRDAMTAFLTKVAERMHESDLELWLCVPTGKDLQLFDLDSLAEHVDHFVAVLHDENAESDQPGPVASKDYFNGWLDTLLDEYGEPSQWVVSIGSYGYDWQDGAREAEPISFEDAMSRAGRASPATIDFDAPTFNPHYVYEDSGTLHTVWFLDAVTFFNQLTAVRSKHAGGVAVMRLGTEDPDIWNVLALDTTKAPEGKDLVELETISAGAAIAQIGKGNLITVVDEQNDGVRRIAVTRDADSTVGLTEQYQTFPGYLTVVHQGAGAADSATITFDDGPDPEWTPQILDILKKKGVQATFFMLGINMEKHPDLVQRVLREGHLIGVHTYTHPNIALVSVERARLEFNATQRLLESITGQSTVLFRPPYNADTNPHDPEELVPIKLAQQMGYMAVTEDIDPEDWAQPGVEKMMDVIRSGRQQGGKIILLHDAGGDRSQTVQALPGIIDYLRNRGDTIVSLPQLLDIAPSELMPVVTRQQQRMTRMISGSGFKTLHAMAGFFWAFMIVATGLTVLKTLAVSWLAIRSRRSDEAPLAKTPFSPSVSVLMAAFNEEKVIGTTLQSVLKTDYPGSIEVIVVDDGSTDQTAAIVSAMAEEDDRIRLIRQVNLGKAKALRNGFDAVNCEIVVSLDADTQFTPETIQALVLPFADPKVGAVSGRARVGNARTLFARFQALEYTCGFNLDRRAYHRLNCITVVPGAVSALRLSAMQAAGGISTDTLAEDTDLTLCLHKCGYRIFYAPKAIAWTEAPETARTFAKQRFRWAFGTLQCLWKHRDLLFAPRYGALGWFSLPSAWFFNILLVATGSLVDIFLLCSLILSPANHILYFYFLIFLASDLLLAAVACWVERESLSQIWLVLPMRFIYRPVLNYVVIKAILRALKGAWVGWGKLDRTASVDLQGMKGKA